MSKVEYNPQMLAYHEPTKGNAKGIEKMFVYHNDTEDIHIPLHIQYIYHNAGSKSTLYIVGLWREDEPLEEEIEEIIINEIKSGKEELLDKLWDQIVEGEYPEDHETCIMRRGFERAKEFKIKQFGSLSLKQSFDNKVFLSKDSSECISSYLKKYYSNSKEIKEAMAIFVSEYNDETYDIYSKFLLPRINGKYICPKNEHIIESFQNTPRAYYFNLDTEEPIEDLLIKLETDKTSRRFGQWYYEKKE